MSRWDENLGSLESRLSIAAQNLEKSDEAPAEANSDVQSGVITIKDNGPIANVKVAGPVNVHDVVLQDLDPRRNLPSNGYPYLDQKLREEAEIIRARVEGREPDLDNPGTIAGTPTKYFGPGDGHNGHLINGTAYGA